MPPKKDDFVRLRHMLDAAREAVDFAAGRDFPSLAADRQLQHSLIHCLEIVGEAANQVTHELQRSIPEIPWRDMIDMRNRLIHVYHDINLGFIWETVTDNLPPLIVALEQVLAEHDSGQLI